MNYLSKDMFIEMFKSYEYANIHYTGSVKGMIKLGYWNKTDTIVRCGKYIYNVSRPVKDNALYKRW